MWMAVPANSDNCVCCIHVVAVSTFEHYSKISEELVGSVVTHMPACLPDGSILLEMLFDFLYLKINAQFHNYKNVDCFGKPVLEQILDFSIL